MTYRDEMVLPKNAVEMKSEDMLLVEGGFDLPAFIAGSIVGGIIYDICRPWLIQMGKSLTARNKGYYTLHKNGKTYKAYWNGTKFTQLKCV